MKHESGCYEVHKGTLVGPTISEIEGLSLTGRDGDSETNFFRDEGRDNKKSNGCPTSLRPSD